MKTEHSVKLSAIVCAERNIPESMLLAKTRKSEIIQARQIYTYVLMKVFMLKPKQVSKIVGYDRSLVYYCIKKVDGYAETNRMYRESLQRVMRASMYLRQSITEEHRKPKQEPQNVQLTEAARNLIDAMDQMRQALLCLHV